MARANNGINGSVSGKVGPNVFYKWKNIDCVRSQPRVNKNRKLSHEEVQNRGRFGCMQRFLSPLKELIRVGFHNYEENRTAFNSAMSYNLTHAIAADDDGLHIDHTNLRICKGLASLLTSTTITYQDGDLYCEWDFDRTLVSQLSVRHFRTVIAIIPDDASVNVCGDIIGNNLIDKSQNITMTNKRSGCMYHVHIGFVSIDHSDRKIDSLYAGSFTI